MRACARSIIVVVFLFSFLYTSSALVASMCTKVALSQPTLACIRCINVHEGGALPANTCTLTVMTSARSCALLFGSCCLWVALAPCVATRFCIAMVCSLTTVNPKTHVLYCGGLFVDNGRSNDAIESERFWNLTCIHT